MSKKSMFVSYTLPLSQFFLIIFITAIAFMHTTTELTVHLAAKTVSNVALLLN